MSELRYQCDLLFQGSKQISDTESYVNESVLNPAVGMQNSFTCFRSEFSSAMQSSISGLLGADGKALTKGLVFYSKALNGTALEIRRVDEDLSNSFTSVEV